MTMVLGVSHWKYGSWSIFADTYSFFFSFYAIELVTIYISQKTKLNRYLECALLSNRVCVCVCVCVFSFCFENWRHNTQVTWPVSSFLMIVILMINCLSGAEGCHFRSKILKLFLQFYTFSILVVLFTWLEWESILLYFFPIFFLYL